MAFVGEIELPTRGVGALGGAPTSWGDVAAATFDAMLEVDNSNSRLVALERSYDDRIDAIRRSFERAGIGDPRLFNPMLMARGGGPDAQALFNNRLIELADRHPEHRDVIRPDRSVEEDARERARLAEERTQTAMLRYGGRLPVWTATLSGGIAGSFYDPINVLSLAAGPWGRVPLGATAAARARALMWQGVRTGAVNAGAEAAIQPFVQAWRREAGLHYGFGPAAFNMAAAFGLGFGADVGIRGAFRALAPRLGFVPRLDQRGRVEGWMRPLVGDQPYFDRVGAVFEPVLRGHEVVAYRARPPRPPAPRPRPGERVPDPSEAPSAGPPARPPGEPPDIPEAAAAPSGPPERGAEPGGAERRAAEAEPARAADEEPEAIAAAQRELEEHYAARNIHWDLTEPDVRALANLMMRGATVDEALAQDRPPRRGRRAGGRARREAETRVPGAPPRHVVDEMAEELGIADRPDIRGARQTAENQARVTEEASPFMAEADRAEAQAQAIRAALDEDEPPPIAPMPVMPVRQGHGDLGDTPTPTQDYIIDGKPVLTQVLAVADIGFDEAAFQFRSPGNDTLAGAALWDPYAADRGFYVYERLPEGGQEVTARFTTARGSRYIVDAEGHTIRDRAPGPGSRLGRDEPGGLQRRTDQPTYYVTPEDSLKLGEIQAEGPRRTLSVHAMDEQGRSGRMGVRYVEGKDAGKIEKRTSVPFRMDPEVGLIPVERWEGRPPHFGNEITEVTRAEPGRLVVAEGHNRLRMAHRLMDMGHEPLHVRASVFREADGWTVSDVRALAAKKNLQEGRLGRPQDVIDAARVIRERPDILDGSVPISNHSMRQARALARLSDDAWARVFAGDVDYNHAALVGAFVEEPGLHGRVMDEIANIAKEERARREKLSADRVRYIINDVLSESSEVLQAAMLGADPAPALRGHRVMVLDRAIRLLKFDQRVFRMLVTEQRRITDVRGNVLNFNENADRILRGGLVQAALEGLAFRPGPVRDWLIEAAREASLARGNRAVTRRAAQRAAERFAELVRTALERDGFAGLKPYEATLIDGGRGIDVPGGPEARAQIEALEAAHAAQHARNLRRVAEQEVRRYVEAARANGIDVPPMNPVVRAEVVRLIAETGEDVPGAIRQAREQLELQFRERADATATREQELATEVQANLPAHQAALEEFYRSEGLAWDLSDQDVAALARIMADGRTAEQALRQYRRPPQGQYGQLIAGAGEGLSAAEMERFAALGRQLGQAPTEATGAAPAGAAAVRRIVTPGGEMEVEARPELVELDTLRHAEGDLQPRDRTRAESEVEVRRRAAGLDPEQLQAARVSDSGAPVVGEDSTILSGNGRVMSIRLVYETPAFKPQADAYRAALVQQYPQARGMRRPVLIMRAQGLSPEDARRFADLSNRSRIAAMSATERARRDAAAAGPELMALYRGGEFTAAQNRAFVEAFSSQVVSPAERPSFAKDGALTKEGSDRMSAALLAAAYGEPDLLVRMLESTDDNVRSISGALRDAAGRFIALKADIAAGIVRPEFDIALDIAAAVRLIADLRARGVRLAAHLDQADAFEGVDPAVESIVRTLYNEELTRQVSRQKITEVLGAYADEARQRHAQSLIDDPATPPDVLALARQRIADPDAPPGPGDLFAPGPAGRGLREGGAEASRQGPGGRRPLPEGTRAALARWAKRFGRDEAPDRAYDLNNDEARQEATAFVRTARAGDNVVFLDEFAPGIAEAVQREVAPMMDLFEAHGLHEEGLGYQVGVAGAIEVLRGGLGDDSVVRMHFHAMGGGEFTATGTWREFKTSGGLHEEGNFLAVLVFGGHQVPEQAALDLPAAGDLGVRLRLPAGHHFVDQFGSVFVSDLGSRFVAASRNFGDYIRGVFIHELGHALWSRLDDSVRGLLIGHADRLGILDMRYVTFRSLTHFEPRRLTDQEIAEKFETWSIRDIYEANLRRQFPGDDPRSVARRTDKLNEEAVMHMLQLAYLGAIKAEDLAPVRHILEGIFNGRREHLTRAIDAEPGLRATGRPEIAVVAPDERPALPAPEGDRTESARPDSPEPTRDPSREGPPSRRTLSIPGLKAPAASGAVPSRAARRQVSGVLSPTPHLAWTGLPEAEYFANLSHIASKRELKEQEKRFVDLLDTPEKVDAHIRRVLEKPTLGWIKWSRGTPEALNLVRWAKDHYELVGIALGRAEHGAGSSGDRLVIATAFNPTNVQVAEKLSAALHQNGNDILRWNAADPASRSEILRLFGQVPTNKRGPHLDEARAFVRAGQAGPADPVLPRGWGEPEAPDTPRDPSLEGPRAARGESQVALEAAQTMERAGRTEEDIWRATGWFRWHGRWAREFPDVGLTMRPEARRALRRGRATTTMPAATAFSHLEMWRRYPELAHLTVELRQYRTITDVAATREAGFAGPGGQQPGRPAYADLDRGRMVIVAATPEEAQQKFLREVHRFIARAEGFPEGGSPEAAAAELARIGRSIDNQITAALERWDALDAMGAAAPVGAREVLAAEIDRLTALAQAAEDITPIEGYGMLAGTQAGEAIAARMGLGAADLRAVPFTEAMTVPPEWQVVLARGPGRQFGIGGPEINPAKGIFAAPTPHLGWTGLPDLPFRANLQRIVEKRQKKTPLGFYGPGGDLHTAKAVREHIEVVLGAPDLAWIAGNRDGTFSLNVAKLGDAFDRVVPVSLSAPREGAQMIPTVFNQTRAETAWRFVSAFDQQGERGVRWRTATREGNQVGLHLLEQVSENRRGPSWDKLRELLRARQEALPPAAVEGARPPLQARAPLGRMDPGSPLLSDARVLPLIEQLARAGEKNVDIAQRVRNETGMALSPGQVRAAVHRLMIQAEARGEPFRVRLRASPTPADEAAEALDRARRIVEVMTQRRYRNEQIAARVAEITGGAVGEGEVRALIRETRAAAREGGAAPETLRGAGAAEGRDNPAVDMAEDAERTKLGADIIRACKS